MDKNDISFDKNLNNYLVENKIQGVFISSRDHQCYVVGEKSIVTLIKSDPNLTVKDLVTRINEESQNEADHVVVDIWRGPNCFPKMSVNPNSKDFSSDYSRTYLRKVLNILGYDRNSFKKYGGVNHEPDGWPTEVSWTNFKGPSHCKISEVKLICKSLFARHMEGVSFDHHYKGYQPPPPSDQDDLIDDNINQDSDTTPVVDRPPPPSVASTPIIPSSSGTPTVQFVRNAKEKRLNMKKTKKNLEISSSDSSDISQSELTFTADDDTELEAHSTSYSDHGSDNEEAEKKKKKKKKRVESPIRPEEDRELCPYELVRANAMSEQRKWLANYEEEDRVRTQMEAGAKERDKILDWDDLDFE